GCEGSGPVVYVGYARISTGGKPSSGLGLEAQEAAIRTYLRSGDRLLLPIMVEAEDGRRRVRPMLQAALDLCRAEKATLLVARADRLAHNRAFTRGVTASGIAVEFCDPANVKSALRRLRLGARTLAAREAAEARHARQFGHRGDGEIERRFGHAAEAESRRLAASAALSAAALITEAKRREDMAGLAAIAKALNDLGARSPRGVPWSAVSVRNVLARAQENLHPTHAAAQSSAAPQPTCCAAHRMHEAVPHAFDPTG
ncbi:MAG TPA: recombinase family protein, partial [Acetobacteraceae bacterium]|nr:recombinase family protein [Acetobacteraceae bacterium]